MIAAWIVFIVVFFLAERKAHPPLGAGAEVYHGVSVVVTGKHVNRTAPSGWMVRLVLHDCLWLDTDQLLRAFDSQNLGITH